MSKNMGPSVFLKVTVYYPDYLKKFYKENQRILGLSYDDHQKILMDDCFGWSNFFQKNLESIGHTAYELVINDEFLQKKWAIEHNLNYSKNDWIQDILISQINYYKPDIIIWEIPAFFNSKLERGIFEISAKKILNLAHICTLYSDFDFLKKFEVVLSCSEFQYTQLKRHNIDSHIFRQAFEPSILTKIGNTNRSIDISFIGALGSKTGFHSNRYKLIEYLLGNSEIEIWNPMPSYKDVAYENISLFYNCIKSHNFDYFWSNNSIITNVFKMKNQYPTRFHDGIYGLKMFDVLSRSKITINCHCNSNVTGEYAGNMRLFEATGMGTLLITDWKKNLSDLFEPDKEVITYKTPEECVEKIQYYLEHDHEREAIARAGQERTLKEHTYHQRIKELVEIINNYKKSNQ
jgi:spore maturation protein CgeB